MVNLIPDLAGISALLHGDLGGVVLDILFLGTLLFGLQLDSFYLLFLCSEKSSSDIEISKSIAAFIFEQWPI